ncbi:MAG: glycosyltransferase [Candidatus Electrothrix sp. Rat3]|nr:glycosyltransferase [Candidatus Electrothrix rattekaaiensis]
MPTFSVIIPLYNKLAYIGRSVESVLVQSFKDFELIVIDDGSTDGSSEELLDIKDERLHILRKENQGVGKARNTGMQHAEGQWIAFLDADDAWMPEHLSELRRVTEAFPSAGLISTRCVESATADLSVADKQKSVPSSIRSVDYFYEASKNIGFVNSTSTAINKDVFVKLGGFTSAVAGEDLEYWARIALHYPVAVSDRVTCFYFRSTGGVMEKLSTNRMREPKGLTRIRDLSASVAMLCDYFEKDPSLQRNPSIVAYINSRVENAVRGALYRGNPKLAKSYFQFMQKPINRKQRVYSLLLTLPCVVLQAAVMGYNWAKSLC